MTREEFEALRNRAKTRVETLKSFLKAEGIAYSTYNYWLRKTRSEQEPHPMAPITIREAQGSNAETTLGGVGLPGVTLALPSGLRAHFGQGSERVLHAFMYSLAESCRLNSVNIQDYFICLFSSARSRLSPEDLRGPLPNHYPVKC